MARDGVEPWLDGQRHAARVLSNRPRPLYDYFKHCFAQVHEPADRLHREELITSAETRLARSNLLQSAAVRLPATRDQVADPHNEEFAKVRRMDLPGLRVGVLPILFRVTRGEKASSSR